MWRGGGGGGGNRIKLTSSLINVRILPCTRFRICPLDVVHVHVCVGVETNKM